VNFAETIMNLYPSIFDVSHHEALLLRLDALQADSQRLWGTMTPAQMCAHVCVSYEYAYGLRHDRPPLFMRLVLRLFFRSLLVGAKPYPKSSPTAPSMVVNDNRNFDAEHARLRAFVERAYNDGESFFEGKQQVTLGALSSAEWSTLFYKHLDHHLRQFGV
jgi:hypothetical protein